MSHVYRRCYGSRVPIPSYRLAKGVGLFDTCRDRKKRPLTNMSWHRVVNTTAGWGTWCWGCGQGRRSKRERFWSAWEDRDKVCYWSKWDVGLSRLVTSVQICRCAGVGCIGWYQFMRKYHKPHKPRSIIEAARCPY